MGEGEGAEKWMEAEEQDELRRRVLARVEDAIASGSLMAPSRAVSGDPPVPGDVEDARRRGG